MRAKKQIKRAGHTAAQTMSRREQKTLLRLILSAAILLLAVGMKILTPGLLGTLQEGFSQMVNAEMDVQEVFSAVGRAVSGGEEEGKWEDVYQAVFAPGETETEGGAAPIASYVTGEELTTSVLPCYSAENIPSAACMTQQVLGFDFAPPLDTACTSGFGLRSDPFTGKEDFHYGLDLAAEEGAAIAAFADGTVRAVGESSILGHYLMIDHAGGYTTLYAHCSRILVTSGAEVSLGEPVAEVGQSGSATGPHLHFELLRGSTYLNPVYYLV